MNEDLNIIFGEQGEKQLAAAISHLQNTVIQLTASVDRMGAQMSEAGGETQKAASQVKSAGFSIQDAFKLVGVNLGVETLVQGVKDLAFGAFNAAKNYETLSISLGVLLGDASKVPQVLEEWKRFSDATPFEPDQVNKAGKALLAFGFSSDQIIPKLTAIGDVAAGTGKDFNELATIYGKARVAGTLYAEDINQLTEAGVPIMEELAAVLGVQTDQVKKLGSQGKITFDVFEKAFGNLVGEGGKFGGLMDKLSASTDGILSTLKGEFDTLLREVGTALLPTIKELAQAAIPAIKKAVEQLRPALQQFAEWMAMIVEKGKELWGALKEVIKPFMQLRDLVSPLADAVDGLNGAVGVSESQFQFLVKALRIAGDVLTWIVKAVEDVKAAWKGFVEDYPLIAGAIEGITTALGYMINPLSAIGDLWEAVFGDGAEAVGGLADTTKKALSGLASTAMKEFGATAEQVRNFAASFDIGQLKGMEMGDAMEFVKQKFYEFIHPCVDAKKKTDDFTKAVGPASGSISALEAKINLLNDAFKATGDEIKRQAIAKELESLNVQLERMQNGVLLEKLAPKGSIESVSARLSELKKAYESTIIASERTSISNEIATLNEELERLKGGYFLKFQTDSVNLAASMRETATGATSMWEAIAQGDTVIDQSQAKLTTYGQLVQSFGQGMADAMVSAAEAAKGALVSFGAEAAQSIGYAIGAAESVGDAFRAAVQSLLVEVPKLAGMALLNTAATVPGPQSLPLAIAGLALLGLSGLIKGLGDRKRKEREQAGAGLPEVGTARPSVAGGFGGFAQQMQSQPIIINLSAEMDGVEMGGVIKTVEIKHGKRSIKG